MHAIELEQRKKDPSFESFSSKFTNINEYFDHMRYQMIDDLVKLVVSRIRQDIPDFHPVQRGELRGDEHEEIPGHHTPASENRIRQAGNGDTARELCFQEVRGHPFRGRSEDNEPQAAPTQRGFAGHSGLCGEDGQHITVLQRPDPALPFPAGYGQPEK